jgi:UDPglucose--hexose-1-phosphate uridylyltransferase
LDVETAAAASLASMLGGVLRGLQREHGDLSLNVIFHLAPVPGADESFADPALDALGRLAVEQWHGHIEVLPRLSRLAGFETGTGYAINSVEPEEAAARLRATAAGSGEKP